MNGPTVDFPGRLDAVMFEAEPTTLQLTFLAGGALARLGFCAPACLEDAQFLVKRLHPDEREAVLALLRAVGADHKERHIEHRMVAADGDERWFRTGAHGVEDERGRRLIVLMIDMTEARHSAEALQAAQSRLKQVLDASGTFTLAEGKRLESLHLTLDGTVGRTVFEGAFKDELRIADNLKRALRGEPFTAYDEVGAFGSWWETRWAPLRDASGRPAGATAVALHVTDRKRAEDDPALAMSLLRATLEATTDGILVVDNDGRIVDFNRRFVELWRIPKEILEQRDDSRALEHVVNQLRDPDAFLAKVRGLYADLSVGSHDVLEFCDGRIFERESQPQRVAGKTVGRVWSFRDVTSERRAIRRATFLAAASKLLAGPLDDATPLDVIARLMVPYLGDWCNIFLLDDERQVRSVAACHIDSSKVPLLHQLQPDLRQRDRGVARVFATGEPVVYNDITDVELSGGSQCGTVSTTGRDLDLLRALELRGYMAVPLNVRGQVTGVMTFSSAHPQRRYDDEDLTLASDLAQRTALALDNQRLYRASKQAVALRDEFLSVASHELRTPLTSMQLAVQSALSMGDEAPAAFLRQALTSAERQTRRLGRLVDALLDVSRVHAGRLDLVREPTDLVTIVRDVATLLTEDAQRAGSCITVEPAEPTLVGGWDRARLEQVVTNLLTNAIKYGSGAPVVVSLRRIGDRARIEVRDRGIGISPDELGRIFERFERAVSARHYGGLGLGLYIVRRIVDAHQGHVAVESAPGAGANFVVELPI